MRLNCKMVAASVVALLSAPPAVSAATLTTFLGPNSGVATQTCTGDVGLTSGASAIHASAVCFHPAVGTAAASATAAVGHLGARTDAVSHNNDSLAAGNGATAGFTDFVVFHQTAGSGATNTDVSLNLLLDGVLNAAADPNSGNAGASIEGFVILNQSFFKFAYSRQSDGSTAGSTDFVGVGDIFAPHGAVAMHTPFVTVALDTPIQLRLQLQAGAGASGLSSSALSDFGGTFRLPTDSPVFTLADGFTVNAGDYLVNNRFIDPEGAGVPEPRTWSLALLGLGLAGAALRRRSRATSATPRRI